jgi:hypothetical protein
MNSELTNILKEMFVANFKLLFLHSAGSMVLVLNEYTRSILKITTIIFQETLFFLQYTDVITN